MTTTFTLNPNTDLFVDVLAHIEREPKSWRQGAWYTIKRTETGWCGTAACFAGWACTLAAPGLPMVMDTYKDLLAGTGVCAVDDVASWRLPDGERRNISDLATELLGIDLPDNVYELADRGELTQAQAEAIDLLFAGSNNLESLYEFVATILAMDIDDLHVKVDNRVAELAAQDIVMPDPVDSRGERIV